MLNLTAHSTPLTSNEDGSSLIELAVSGLLIAVLVVGLMGALIVGLRAGANVDVRDLGRMAGRSQIEHTLALPFSSDYDESPSTPATLDTNVGANTVTSDTLQSLDMSALSTLQGVGETASIETYKANRFLDDVFIAPPSGGLEIHQVFDIPTLNKNQNFFVVVEVFPSVTATDIEVRWQLAEEGQGLISIFQGKPFGDGNGFANGAGGGSPKVGFGNIKGDDLGILARDVAPGFYTIHLNMQAKTTPSAVTISCLCPGAG